MRDRTYTFVIPKSANAPHLRQLALVSAFLLAAFPAHEADGESVDRGAARVGGAIPSALRAREAGSTEGFYKDLFIDGGAKLSSRGRLHAANSLGLSYEYYAGGDEARQNLILAGSSDDTNGALLYPDGQPRFRMIYVHGGGATAHGRTLKLAGRRAMRTLYHNGGSYCGSCAGSFLSGRNVDSKTLPRLGYLHIYPYNYSGSTWILNGTAYSVRWTASRPASR